MNPRPSSFDSAKQTYTLLAFSLVVCAVVIRTNAFHGWFAILDSVPGPHLSVPGSIWGVEGGYNSALPYSLAFVALLHVFGSFGSWLPFASALVLAMIGAARLTNGATVGRVGAALLYGGSPIVFERMWSGQIGYLVGYALLPWLIASLANTSETKLRKAMLPAIWWAAMTACSVHFLWIGLVPVLLFVFAARFSFKSLLNALAQMVAVALMSAYLWSSGTSGVAGAAVGPSDLIAFATQSDSHYGLFVNVFGLYGFWRNGVQLPKDVVHFWLTLLIAISALVIYGLWRRSKSENKRIVFVLIGCAVVGFFAALGAQGPFGSMYSWFYGHVPGFGVMREPQKFAALLAVLLAVAFGWGVNVVWARPQRATRLVAAALLALPIVYSWPLYTKGSPSAITYPKDYATANKLMANGQGSVLMLPWHQYLQFDFGKGRTMASPADALFDRPVISGDNTELNGLVESQPLRSQFLQFLFSKGQTLRNFGAQVRPFGIEYVVVSKSIDWQQYQWLNHQDDLDLVLDSPHMSVFHNRHTAPVGYRGQQVDVANWGESVALTETYPDRPFVFTARHDQPGPIHVPVTPDLVQNSGTVKYKSQISRDVSTGTGAIALTDQFDSRWKLDSQSPQSINAGNTGFSDSASGIAHFDGWSTLRRNYVISITVTVLIVLSQLANRRSKSDVSFQQSVASQE